MIQRQNCSIKTTVKSAQMLKIRKNVEKNEMLKYFKVLMYQMLACSNQKCFNAQDSKG